MLPKQYKTQDAEGWRKRMGTSMAGAGRGVMRALYVSHIFLYLAILCSDYAAVKVENINTYFSSLTEGKCWWSQRPNSLWVFLRIVLTSSGKSFLSNFLELIQTSNNQKLLSGLFKLS